MSAGAPPAEAPQGWRLPALDDRARATLRADYWLATGNGAAYGVLFIASVFGRIALGSSRQEVAMIETAAHVGLLLTLLLGAWSEGRRQVPLVFWPVLVPKLVLLGVAFATSSVSFTAVICLAWAFDGIPDTARTTIYHRNYPGPLRGQIVGRIRFVQTLARLAVAGIAALCLRYEPHAYRVLFPAAGLIGLACCLPYRRVPETLAPDIPRTPFRANLGRAVSLLWRDRPFARFMGLWFVFGFANIASLPLLVEVIKDATAAAELAPGDATFHATLLRNVVPPVCWLLTFFFWGRVLDRSGPVRMRGALNLAWAACPLMAGLFPGLGPLYVAYVIQGLAQGGTQLIWTLGVLPYARRPEEVPLYMAVHTSLTGVRGVIAPFFGFWLSAQAGLHPALLILGSVMVATGVATLLFVDPREAGPAKA